MPSELDIRSAAVLDALMAEGQPLELTEARARGRMMPSFKNVPQTLPAYYAAFCAMHGDKEFLVDEDRRLTFADCYAAARALAGGLVEGHGVRKGDRVGIAARNSANWIVLDMAIAMAGGVTAKLNGWWQSEEFADAVKDVDCALVFADEQRAARLEPISRETGLKVEVFRHDAMPLDGLACVTARGGGADTPLPEVGPDDVATILFTSGSTGRSKGAFSTHRAVVMATMNYVGAFLVLKELMTAAGTMPAAQPSALVAVPLFHVTAAVPLVLVSYAIGRKLVMQKKWDAREAMRLIERERISYFVGVPLMSWEIITHPERERFDLSSVTHMAAGGAPRPAEHVKRIKEAMGEGFPILGYGLTETNGVGCGNTNENYLERPNSTGRASPPLVEMRILDDDGREVPTGERGEVCLRSICNFSGYWGQEAATEAAFTADGFFKTGDIGYVDEEGFLFIVDRKKDIIIRGGENISCPEVEAAAYEHPQVAEAAVFGVPDERFGEVPAMVWHPAEDATLSDEQLRDFLGERLAAFKVPQYLWRYDDPLPRLGTEKVDKRTLSSRHRAELAEAA